MANKLFGLIIFGLIATFIGISLLQAIASNTSLYTSQITVTNSSYTAPAVNGTIDLLGQEIFGTPLVYNGSGNGSDGSWIGSGNYTIDEGISATTGLKSVQYTVLDAGSAWASETVNFTYDYGPDGYIDSAAGRSVTLLIVLFAVIGIVIAVLSIVFKSDLMTRLARR